MNLKKGFTCIGLGLFLTATLCMDIILVLLETAVYTSSSAARPLWQHCFHFILICCIWGAGSVLAYHLADRHSLLPASGNGRKYPSRSHIAIIFLAIAAGILFMSFNAGMRLKPLTELLYFLNTYGNKGLVIFLLQHLYYLFESILILLLIILGQQAGEFLFPQSPRIPWGGIFCALTWGMLHGLTKDWETAFFCIILSSLFYISYQAADRRFLLSYLAVALIFIF